MLLMPRPSQNLDQALLQAGRELFVRSGCAGLSVRAVAERAGANPGMFHYHFKTKDNFLRVLLQQVYEEMFDGLAGALAHDGPALERLRDALLVVGGLLREHRQVFARVWMDAVGGEPVAAEFLRRNAPRHIGVLLALLDEAQAEGALQELPPMQRLVLLMGAVLLPIVFAGGLADVAFAGTPLRRQFDEQVMSDEAIAERVELAIGMLGAAPARRTR
jgi:AcrR family transcriptional regulator